MKVETYVPGRSISFGALEPDISTQLKQLGLEQTGHPDIDLLDRLANAITLLGIQRLPDRDRTRQGAQAPHEAAAVEANDIGLAPDTDTDSR
jgi:hypothetical protein